MKCVRTECQNLLHLKLIECLLMENDKIRAIQSVSKKIQNFAFSFKDRFCSVLTPSESEIFVIYNGMNLREVYLSNKKGNIIIYRALFNALLHKYDISYFEYQTLYVEYPVLSHLPNIYLQQLNSISFKKTASESELSSSRSTPFVITCCFVYAKPYYQNVRIDRGIIKHFRFWVNN